MSEHQPLSIEVRGPESGERVLLLNPMASNSQSWYPLVKSLGDYEIVLLEYPGYDGRPYAAAASVEELARRASAALRALPPKPIHLVGYSFGSWVAQQIALLGEVEVKSLVLIGSSDRIYQLGVQMTGQWAGLLDVAGLEAVLAQIAFWSFSPATFEKSADFLQRFVQGGVAACSDPAVLRNQLEICGRYQTRPALESIAAPTLVLRGELDFFYPRFCSEALVDGIPGSTLVELPGVAHAALWEDPKGVIREIVGFLADR